jgi:H/ACA ribonucleoprotein complex non-core subunit NAF1
MDRFKVPQSIPQDLLLIQEYIGVLPPLPAPQKPEPAVDDEEDDINSSSEEESDNASEEEIAADLIAAEAVTDEDDLVKEKYVLLFLYTSYSPNWFLL